MKLYTRVHRIGFNKDGIGDPVVDHAELSDPHQIGFLKIYSRHTQSETTILPD